MTYYLIFLAILSIITFFAYGIDKQKAKANAWRIKEATLLLMGFLGGSIGALLGMKVFRHKTKHFYFYLVNVLGLIVQGFILIYFFL